MVILLTLERTRARAYVSYGFDTGKLSLDLEIEIRKRSLSPSYLMNGCERPSCPSS
jgi:hypothetical protein